MAITVRPTQPDIEIARAIARNISPVPEEVGELVSWGADEHVLTAASVACVLPPALAGAKRGMQAARCAGNDERSF